MSKPTTGYGMLPEVCEQGYLCFVEAASSWAVMGRASGRALLLLYKVKKCLLTDFEKAHFIPLSDFPAVLLPVLSAPWMEPSIFFP